MSDRESRTDGRDPRAVGCGGRDSSDAAARETDTDPADGIDGEDRER